MDSGVTPERAKMVLDMLTSGGAMDEINTPLALRLIPLALELGDEELAQKLLDHAADVAEDEVEAGWAKFEVLKHISASTDSYSELAVAAEQMDDGFALAAAIYHHLALIHLSQSEYDEAKVFANRSIRHREEIEDKQGITYGIGILEAIAKKQQDFDSAIAHGTRRVEILMRMNDEEGQMEAMADLAHSQATIGQFDAAADLFQESLNLAIGLEDLSGQLVARWGLADLAEINEDYETAMLQLSDLLHSFVQVNIPAPPQVRQRIQALTDIQDQPKNE